MTVFKHFILTRFNLRKWVSRDAPSEEWLYHRFDLFERFCFPSLRSQTNQDFKWIVFFDANTPLKFRTRIEGYASWENFIPIFLKEYNLNLIKQQLVPFIGRAKYLITTRVDNDDAIAKYFVKLVQQNFNRQHLEFINFMHGFIWNDGRIHLSRQMRNPFMSLIESNTNPKTVWCASHLKLSDFGEIKQIATPPAWLQVVHDRNVYNKVQCVVQPCGALPASFVINPSGLKRYGNSASFSG